MVAISYLREDFIYVRPPRDLIKRFFRQFVIHSFTETASASRLLMVYFGTKKINLLRFKHFKNFVCYTTTDGTD